MMALEYQASSSSSTAVDFWRLHSTTVYSTIVSYRCYAGRLVILEWCVEHETGVQVLVVCAEHWRDRRGRLLSCKSYRDHGTV